MSESKDVEQERTSCSDESSAGISSERSNQSSVVEEDSSHSHDSILQSAGITASTPEGGPLTEDTPMSEVTSDASKSSTNRIMDSDKKEDQTQSKSSSSCALSPGESQKTPEGLTCSKVSSVVPESSTATPVESCPVLKEKSEEVTSESKEVRDAYGTPQSPAVSEDTNPEPDTLYLDSSVPPSPDDFFLDPIEPHRVNPIFGLDISRYLNNDDHKLAFENILYRLQLSNKFVETVYSEPCWPVRLPSIIMRRIPRLTKEEYYDVVGAQIPEDSKVSEDYKNFNDILDKIEKDVEQLSLPKTSQAGTTGSSLQSAEGTAGTTSGLKSAVGSSSETQPKRRSSGVEALADSLQKNLHLGDLEGLALRLGTRFASPRGASASPRGASASPRGASAKSPVSQKLLKGTTTGLANLMKLGSRVQSETKAAAEISANQQASTEQVSGSGEQKLAKTVQSEALASETAQGDSSQAHQEREKDSDVKTTTSPSKRSTKSHPTK